MRPFNENEIETGVESNLRLTESGVTINNKPNTEFKFDHVFGPDTTQKDVYKVAAKPIIDSVLEGFNGTILAYGQTSSGKTFTMQGPDVKDTETQGVIPRMVQTVFDRIQSAGENMKFTVKVSMV